MFGLSNNIIEEFCSIFKKHPNIDEVLIFGSRAKGNYSEGSDIDLALKGKDVTFDQIMNINLQIDDLGLLYKVDVLFYNDKIGTPIGGHIDRVGKVFYTKNNA
jgi:uncharacterized protein